MQLAPVRFTKFLAMVSRRTREVPVCLRQGATAHWLQCAYLLHYVPHRNGKNPAAVKRRQGEPDSRLPCGVSGRSDIAEDHFEKER
jgi:hypothetical protein